MAFAEVIALMGLLLAGGTTVAQFARWRARRHDRLEEAMDKAMRALTSNDYRKIDDVLVLYADALPSKVASHLSTRRDELYIEKNQ